MKPLNKLKRDLLCDISSCPDYNFRGKLIYGEYRKTIGDILRKLCEYKVIEIVEANACVEHIHKCI